MVGEIFFNIGLAFHQMGEHIESAKNFQWALELSPNNKKYIRIKINPATYLSKQRGWRGGILIECLVQWQA